MIFLKNIITIRGLQECGHARDFETQGANARECGTCRVLLGLAQVYFAFQWDFRNISRAEDYLHLLPTSNFIHELSPLSGQDEAKPTLSAKTGKLSYAIWVPWTLGSKLRRVNDHPIIHGLLQQDVIKVRIRRSFAIFPGFSPIMLWHGTDFRIWNYWIRSSLAKRPGSIYSQMPDAKVETVRAPPLPTRVLDLMPNGFPFFIARTLGSKHLTVRLVAPPPGTKGSYLTLSHRWGLKCHLQTTKANQDQLTKGIWFNSLPKTYRDAAIVAILLGYRYLWIDSLCIVQDDPDDWLRESARMSTIYRNSGCTIASHGSDSDLDGFLHAAFAPRKRYMLSRPSTINSRGWVFQERILPRRILHFAHGAILFEDASGCYCNCSEDYRRPMSLKHIRVHPLAADRKLNLEDAVEKATSCQWYELVEKYSRCQFTYDTDRLPALRGLSQHYRELNGESIYMYGLWYSSFHQGLLWVVTSASPRMAEGYDGTPVPEPPSWSWARWADIQYPCHLDRCEPLGFSILSPRPDDAKLSDGQMVGSKVVTLKVYVLHRQDIIAKQMGDEWLCTNFRESPPNRYNVADTLMGRRPAWLVFDGQRVEEVVSYEELTFAFISFFTNTTFAYKDDDEDNFERIVLSDYTYYFLILQKVDPRSNRYRRIGIGAVKWKSCFDKAKQEVIEIE
ncbi:heterokaryon incompatibility protein-domain-containing protein [Cladorrhinum sp. PSN259]|nr:heterokaryon incompatibility protein-domain-containing protein [Cladorrhinum sp. PSN259]